MKITLSKNQWLSIGKKAGWVKKAQQADVFTDNYIESGLWTITDDEGDYIVDDFTVEQISPETLAQMQQDCASFVQKYGELLAQSGMSMADAGQDFWLTRNGHDVGFWDRKLPPNISDQLTKGARAYGEYKLHVGDDGKVHGR